jgi:hypothetical protein
MESQEVSKGSGLNTNAYRVISFGLVAAMIACAATTVVSLIAQFNPAWQLHYLIALCFIVALDRLYTYRLFRDWMILSKEWLLRFCTEWIILMALTKLMVGLSHGWNAFLAEIPLWQQDFSNNFFTDEFRFILIFVVITWLVSGNFAALLEEIGPEQIQNSLWDLQDYGLVKALPARRRLVGLYFSLGTTLVILTAISRLDLRSMLYNQSFSPRIEIPSWALGGASTLLYFMLGLALLSQTQFISLHVRWNIQRIPVNGKLARQWAVYSILFLVFVAIVVSLLPTGYSMNPLLALSYLLDKVILVFVAIGEFMVAVSLYVLTFLFNLFGMPPPEPQKKIPPPPPPSLNATSIGATATGSDWWQIIKTMIFWAVFLGVLFFALRQYLRQHQEILVSLRKLPAWRFLTQVWQWLRSMWTQAKNILVEVVESGRERARQIAPWSGFGDGFMSLRGLDPRRRIYFFYLAFIRRGGEKGIPRSRSQTPDEYAAALNTALPETGDDIRALTQAFIAARYSRQPVEAEQAQSAADTWERIRKALRGRR